MDELEITESLADPGDQIEYVHIVLSGGCDDISESSLDDVFRLNKLLKHNVKNYKFAFIKYMAKGNDVLEKEMQNMIHSI